MFKSIYLKDNIVKHTTCSLTNEAIYRYVCVCVCELNGERQNKMVVLDHMWWLETTWKATRWLTKMDAEITEHETTCSFVT